MKTLNFRVILFAFALIFGVVFSIPSLTQSESGKKITLGLDLQGGLHMLLGIKSEIAIESRIKSMAASVIPIMDVVMWTRAIPRYKDEARNPHKLFKLQFAVKPKVQTPTRVISLYNPHAITICGVLFA